MRKCSNWKKIVFYQTPLELVSRQKFYFFILNFLHPAICTKRACVAITHKCSLFCVITWNDIQKPLTQCVHVFYIDKKTLAQRSYLLPWCIYCLRSNIQPLESWAYIIVSTWVLILPSKPQPRNFFCPTSTKNLNKSPPGRQKALIIPIL